MQIEIANTACTCPGLGFTLQQPNLSSFFATISSHRFGTVHLAVTIWIYVAITMLTKKENKLMGHPLSGFRDFFLQVNTCVIKE